MMTAMMEQTALLLNPTKASFGEINPIRGKSTIIMMPTTSTLTHSNTNKQITKARTIIVVIISGVIVLLLRHNQKIIVTVDPQRELPFGRIIYAHYDKYSKERKQKGLTPD
jgi:hypothetical protein